MVVLAVRALVSLGYSPWHNLLNLTDEEVRDLAKSVGDLPSGGDKELTGSLNSPEFVLLHLSIMACFFAVVPFCLCPSPTGPQTHSLGTATMLRKDLKRLTLTSNCEIKD